MGFIYMIIRVYWCFAT
ncbi:hypothetical protein CP8484711_1771A, partial [Chlamydia psittaci 84-8471/1]